MNVTREEAITYLTELKDNPIKLINEIDSERRSKQHGR